MILFKKINQVVESVCVMQSSISKVVEPNTPVYDEMLFVNLVNKWQREEALKPTPKPRRKRARRW